MSPEQYVASPVWFGYSGVPKMLNPPKACVLIDLDGTLLNNDHRQHHMRESPPKWGSFFAEMHKDTVYPEIKFIIDLIFKHTNVAVVLTTGRPSQYHGETLQNLQDLEVSFTSLIMRAQTDNRADRDVKLDMLNAIKFMGYAPMFCIDDRPEVVHMWRQQGVRTLQADPSAWVSQTSVDYANMAALKDENERLRARVIELEDSAPPKLKRMIDGARGVE